MSKPVRFCRKCEKNLYRSRSMAGKIAERGVTHRFKGKPEYLRVYHCPVAPGWHLTSKEYRKSIRKGINYGT